MTNRVTFFCLNTLLGQFHCTNFFQSKLLICTKNGAVLSDSWRPKDFRTPWTYTMTNDFEERMILQIMQFYCQKNSLYAPLLDIKPFLTATKKGKHCFKCPKPLEWYDRDGLLSPVWFGGLGVPTYLDFGARLFSTQWPSYGAYI